MGSQSRPKPRWQRRSDWRWCLPRKVIIDMMRFTLTSLVLLTLATPDFAQQPRPAAPAARAKGKRGPGGFGDPFAGQKRLRALVISGGCCHDYNTQNKILIENIAKALPVDWTVLIEGGRGSDGRVALYETPNWTKGFDIVVHNECYANVDDPKLIRQIAAGHKNGVAAIVIHCSLHSYRTATIDDWREFMGATSRHHTQAHNISVKIDDPQSSIVKGIPAGYRTPVDELYVIEKFWPTAKSLASAVSPDDPKISYPIMWTNDYQGARVFGTSLGHGMDTWNDPVFQDLLVRAFKWAVKREQ